MPGVPIAIPSATVMVPYWTGQAPASFTPFLANFPKSCRWILQGVFSAQLEITPMIGFSKLSSVIPVARSIARLGDLTIES